MQNILWKKNKVIIIIYQKGIMTIFGGFLAFIRQDSWRQE